MKTRELLKEYWRKIDEGDIVYGLDIVQYVKRGLRRPFMFADSILRVLRNLRSGAVLDYKCTNKKESKYIKLR